MVEEFDDNIFPQAYLLTFRSYGTWLHGDKRGSVDRRKFNRYGAAGIKVNSGLENAERKKIQVSAISFNKKQRSVIERSIKEVCVFRNYRLFAVNVRSNHIHCVVSSNSRPEPVMNAFKSYATRNLRKLNLISEDRKIWSRHGSTRYLWKDHHVSLAMDYVLYCQDDIFPAFNDPEK